MPPENKSKGGVLMKLIATREIPLEDIIPCSILYEREDLGNLNEITGDIFTSIIVRPSKTQQGKFERITGLRRCKKAEKDGKKTIKCDIFEMTDEEAIFVHAKENLQRKDFSPIEKGKQYKKMLETLSKIRGKKVTLKELAKELKKGGTKKSIADISNNMRLLKLAKPVQEFLALKKIGIYHGLLLLQIKDENLQTEMAENCVNNKWTTRKLEEKIRELKIELEDYHSRGYYRFIDRGKDGLDCELILPETIQPEPKPIKLTFMYPYCPEMEEKLKEAHEIYLSKIRACYPPTCHMCPLEKLCTMFDDYKWIKLYDESSKIQIKKYS